MPKILASLRNLKKSYQQPLLAIEKFDILAGKCVIIKGDNGSGKSTFLKIIDGLISADAGHFVYQNQSFLAKKNHPISKHSVYVSSKPYLFDCSVENNVAYPLLLKSFWLPSQKTKQQVADILTWANLNHLKNRHPSSLSTGERQRVALARVRMFNPNIWLLDEPIENLDTEAKNQLRSLLNRLLSEKYAIIIATHNPSAFAKVPHQALVLVNKKLVAEND